MMKILMIIPCYIPAWNYGGPLQACALLSRTLVKNGHRVTVLTTDVLDSSTRIHCREERIDGVDVVRFPNISNAMAKLFNAYTPLRMGDWIKRHIAEFDVVHCHDFFFYPNVQVCRWAERFSVPYLIQPHGCAVPKAERGRTSVKKIFNGVWGKEILRKANAVLAVSETEAHDLIEYLPGIKVEILPNGVELSTLRKSSEWPFTKYGIAPGTPVIISVGRLHPIKGFDLLLDSFIHLRRRRPDVRLCIVGPNEGMLPDLEARTAAAGIQNEVVFTGLVIGKEKEQILSEASLFALFSRNEPFSIAAIEAAACGLPLLISRHIGIASQVMEKGVGEMVDPRDVETAAMIMETMLSPEASARYRGNLHRLLEPFDPERVAARALNLYEEAIRGSVVSGRALPA